MPIAGSVGQSDYTRTKQDHFATIISTHLKIAKSILKKSPWAEPYYLYIDFYAGTGENFESVPGSPIIFMQEAQRIGVNNLPFFVEENEYSAMQLEEAVRNTGANNFTVVSGDNECFSKKVIDNPPANPCYGLAYLDPNGIPNFNIIKEISNIKQYSRLDFLINCPATAIKRAISNEHCAQKTRLVEEILSINKNYWIIREPIGKWQWTFLIGTNWDSFPVFKNLGFWPLSSPEGRDIAMHLSYNAKEIEQARKDGWYQSYPEYLQHPFFKLVRKEVMAKTWGALNCGGGFKKWGFICQDCKQQFATEVHHLRYPKPFKHAFDVPENMIAICHNCHCNIHGKENKRNAI